MSLSAIHGHRQVSQVFVVKMVFRPQHSADDLGVANLYNSARGTSRHAKVRNSSSGTDLTLAAAYDKRVEFSERS